MLVGLLCTELVVFANVDNGTLFNLGYYINKYNLEKDVDKNNN